MTTPTRVTTERAARTAVEARLASPAQYIDQMDDLEHALGRIATLAADPIVGPAIEVLEGLGEGGGWEPLRAEPAGLWRDLRPSEALYLREAISAAVERCEARCRQVILQELVAVAQTFAGLHPDAPRGALLDAPDRVRPLREAVPA